MTPFMEQSCVKELPLPKQTDAGNPCDWLLFAEGDLQAVRLLAGQSAVFSVCRSKLAEALEKLLKADLIHCGWELRKTHDLQSLLDDLASHTPTTANQLQPIVDELAEAYSQTRYPGFDLADDDWPRLRELLVQVQEYNDDLARRLSPKP